MKSIDARLSKLESQQPPHAERTAPRISDAAYNRSMAALADALQEITGTPVTAGQAAQALKDIQT